MKNKGLTTSDKQAFAVTCGTDEILPKVLISGKNEVADLIVEIAKLSGIPIKEDQSLSKMLEGPEPRHSLSLDAIKVLAEVISALYRADNSNAQLNGI
jgi:flagellar biosynthesis protein